MACTGGSQARESAQEFQSVTSTGRSSAAVAALAAASDARRDGAAFGHTAERWQGRPPRAQGERQLLLRVRPGGPKQLPLIPDPGTQAHAFQITVTPDGAMLTRVESARTTGSRTVDARRVSRGRLTVLGGCGQGDVVGLSRT